MATTLSDISTDELRWMLAATERAAGPDSQAAQTLRRIIERREISGRTDPRRPPHS